MPIHAKLTTIAALEQMGFLSPSTTTTTITTLLMPAKHALCSHGVQDLQHQICCPHGHMHVCTKNSIASRSCSLQHCCKPGWHVGASTTHYREGASPASVELQGLLALGLVLLRY